jgi:hypothetical protein
MTFAFSSLLDGETEAGGSKTIPAIKQITPAAMIKDAWVLNHFGIPTIG